MNVASERISDCRRPRPGEHCSAPNGLGQLGFEVGRREDALTRAQWRNIIARQQPYLADK